MKDSFEPYSVHIALSTSPIDKSKEDDYVKHIESIFKKYRDDFSEFCSDDLADFLYSPLKYHFLGHYDLGFISLIDSYKFAQKVFDNAENNYEFTKPISYQIQTGTILKYDSDSDSTFDVTRYFQPEMYEEYPFVKISNLKLNNGLLVGNGYNLQNVVIDAIDQTIKNIKRNDFNEAENDFKFLLLNSYNWSDFILILYGKSPDIFFEILLRLRRLTIADATSLSSSISKIKATDLSDSIFENSLYKKLGYSKHKTIHSHCFADTHSYLGINRNQFITGHSKVTQQKLNTSIEWEVKPGHLPYFYKELSAFQTNTYGSDVLASTSFKSGKTDMITLESKPELLSSNYAFFNSLRSTDLIQHVKSIKTISQYEIKEESNLLKTYGNEIGIIDGPEQLKKYRIKGIEHLNRDLKTLNLSRQLRMKIRKIFYNYNNGIIDPVSYIYIIDFKNFLEYFKNDIKVKKENIESIIHHEKGKSNYKKEYINVNGVEKKYEKIVNAFEEAYYDRMLNNYHFEDLNDFNIDFNTSISQVISTYDTIIKELSPSFCDRKKRLIIRQNELNTISNIISINYNVYHLIEPPLIFCTVVKELMNNLEMNLKILSENNTNPILFEKSEIMKNASERIKAEYLKENDAATTFSEIMEDFDFNYFIYDTIKYFYTHNADTELYVYWTWVFCLQNTTLYSTVGGMLEKSFNRELVRIMLIVQTFEPDFITEDKLTCPIPELYNYWERSYLKIKAGVKIISELPAFKHLVKTMIKIYAEDIIIEEKTNAISFSAHTNDLLKANKEYQLEYEQIDDSNHYYSKYFAAGEETLFNNYQAVQNRQKYLLSFYHKYVTDLEAGISIIKPIERQSPEPEKYDHSIDNNALFYNGISYATLRWYYEKNNKKIDLLRRDYLTGQPEKDFIHCKKDHFFLIDPNGDFFLANADVRRQCMAFKHAVFHSLWHLSSMVKIDLFDNTNNP